jgi:hypothetical protein
LAHAARLGWDHGRPQGIDAGLEETHYWEPSTVTWSYAAHVAIVDVDPEIGRVTIEKYAIARDCGVVVNPLLVEGQITGGTAQGLGGIRRSASCETVRLSSARRIKSVGRRMGLKIVRPQAGMFRDAREHSWPEFLIIVERKHVIRPSWAR